MRTVAVETYETSATVEDRGQVRVAGVPFAPGSEVAVTISPKARPGAGPTATDDDAGPGAPGLRWQGNVLVHEGVGTDPSVADSRNERLSHLAEGRPG